MDTATIRNEFAPGREYAELTAQARAAYQEKRTKECIDITQRVLLADPGNAEANTIYEAVRADMQRDLNDARALLEDSRSMVDGQKYRKAAEIILLKILYLDPDHSEARDLLAQAKSGSSAATSYPSQPIRSAKLDETGFTASPQPVELDPDPRKPINLKVPLIVAGVVVLIAGSWFFGAKAIARIAESIPTSVATPTQTRPSSTPGTNRAVGGNTASTAPTPAGLSVTNHSSTAPVPVPPVPTSRMPVAPPPAPIAPPAPAVQSKPPAAAVAKAPGSLAVNSPIAADIYMNDKYLGATPTTLSLPAGRHTLEYRSGDMRTVMTHEVRSNEITTAFVAFEITIHLNARPWALVFVEGTNRRALGQTPLSSVRVPIGSVLTFENPNFPPKSHRVRSGDSAIQVVFP